MTDSDILDLYNDYSDLDNLLHSDGDKAKEEAGNDDALDDFNLDDFLEETKKEDSKITSDVLNDEINNSDDDLGLPDDLLNSPELPDYLGDEEEGELVEEQEAKPLRQEGLLISSLPPSCREEESDSETLNNKNNAFSDSDDLGLPDNLNNVGGDSDELGLPENLNNIENESDELGLPDNLNNVGGDSDELGLPNNLDDVGVESDELGLPENMNNIENKSDNEEFEVKDLGLPENGSSESDILIPDDEGAANDGNKSDSEEFEVKDLGLPENDSSESDSEEFEVKDLGLPENDSSESDILIPDDEGAANDKEDDIVEEKKSVSQKEEKNEKEEEEEIKEVETKEEVKEENAKEDKESSSDDEESNGDKPKYGKSVEGISPADEDIIFDPNDDKFVKMIFASVPKKGKDQKEKESKEKDQKAKKGNSKFAEFEERNRKSFAVKKAYRSIVDPVKKHSKQDGDKDGKKDSDEDLDSLISESTKAEIKKNEPSKTFMSPKTKDMAEKRNIRVIEGVVGRRTSFTKEQALIIFAKFGLTGKLGESSVKKCGGDESIAADVIKDYILNLALSKRNSQKALIVKSSIANMKNVPLSPRRP